MAELENNLENTEEEVVDTVETPTDTVELAEKTPETGSEKGDKSAPKQGSSDEEKIESGKGDVVKPEENPVDKAVDAVNKAASDVPSNEGNPAKKNAPAPEKGDSLKEKGDSEEDATISKMENIKEVVNKLKAMSKEDVQSIFKGLNEDEIDESLTKAEVARKIVEALKGMDEKAVAEFVGKSFKEEVEEETTDEVEETVDEEASAEVEQSLIEIEVDDDLLKISEALELSDENAEKAKTIFKAAVTSKVTEIKAGLDEQYSEELKTSVEKVKGDLTEAVDKYLTYCAEEWTKENELAIERGLRSEMTENFIDGLKTLFVEHYVEVPEDKYNVIDELANRLDEMEQKLDGEVQKNMDVTEELDSLKRGNVIREACEDLSESQKEKMESLAAGVDFTDTEDFADKIGEVKEAYFKVDGETVAEETRVEEGEGTYADESSDPVLDPTIARYSEAISKLNPL